MKIIDLLNKIANGEEVPYRIKYNGRIYEYANEIKWYLRDDMKCELSNSKKFLNEEVEIIEEPQEHKIPEKLKASDYEEVQSQFDLDVISRINEILDYLEVNNE